MRYSLLALLLTVSAACQAAEIETITLADGRVLVGELTPKGLHGAVVALQEPKGAAVSISMDDVKGREKWQAPQAVVYAPGTEPAPKVKAKTAPKLPASKVRMDEIAAERAPIVARLQEASDALAKLDAERDAIINKAECDFVLSGDLANIPLSLPANATASDEAKFARAQELNARLSELQQYRIAWKAVGSQGRIGGQMRNGFWELYTEFKGGSAPY